jgi:hypothetical protein
LNRVYLREEEYRLALADERDRLRHEYPPSALEQHPLSAAAQSYHVQAQQNHGWVAATQRQDIAQQLGAKDYQQLAERCRVGTSFQYQPEAHVNLPPLPYPTPSKLLRDLTHLLNSQKAPAQLRFEVGRLLMAG